MSRLDGKISLHITKVAWKQKEQLSHPIQQCVPSNRGVVNISVFRLWVSYHHILVNEVPDITLLNCTEGMLQVLFTSVICFRMMTVPFYVHLHNCEKQPLALLGPSICLSVFLFIYTQLAPDRCMWNLISQTTVKICRETPNLFEIMYFTWA